MAIRVREIRIESRHIKHEKDLIIIFTNEHCQTVMFDPQDTPESVVWKLRVLADNIEADEGLNDK